MTGSLDKTPNPEILVTLPETSISEIKNRVLAAATSGLSKTARSTPVTIAHPHENGLISPVRCSAGDGVKSRRQIWQSQNLDTVQFKKANALALPKTAQEQV